MGVGVMRRAILVVLVASLLPAGTADAASSYDPVGSGTTTLTLSPSFSRLLARHDVAIELRGGPKRKGRKILLSASGGEVDPGAGLASVDHAGTVVFVAGKRRLPFRSVVFKAKRAPLYAKVGGGQLKVAQAKTLKVRRQGFGASFASTGLRLTAKVATRIDRKLRLGGAVSAGQELGTLGVSVQPRTVNLLPQGRVYLAIDPAFFAKLNDLFVSLNPIAPAELAPGPVLSFPVGLESTLAPNGSLGTIKVGGAAELLKLRGAQIFWREVWLQPAVAAITSEVDVQPSPPHPGKQPPAPLLSLVPDGTVTATPSKRTIAIAGRTVTLTAPTAAALNDAFASGQPAFAAGERVGALSTSLVAR
jgi:hypothetical protein